MSKLLKLFLFGPPRLERDGQPVNVRGRKIFALAAYLAVTGRSQSRDTVATLLWPDHDQAGARANLRRELSRLNKVLGEGILAVDRENVELGAKRALWLDVDHFEQRLTAYHFHDHAGGELCEDCRLLLTEAVDLYRDDFLAGFTLPDSPEFDDWQFFEREGLRQQLAGTLETLALDLSRRREFGPAITYARRWLALDPLHEPAHRALMRLYALDNQQAAALRQYEECARILTEALGTSPEPETVALYEQIRNRELEPLAKNQHLWPVEERHTGHRFETETGSKEFKASAGPAHNLPALLTPLVGRETELADLIALLDRPKLRLITIVGPGGIGKTHLALEVASHQLDHFTHGVFFVPLAPLESPETMAAAIGKALDFSFYEGSPPEQQLLAYLRQRELLLVLDNFEHLLAGSGLVVKMLQSSPGLKILVTSQATLKIQGEQIFQLSGMEFPPDLLDISEETAQFSGIDLFSQAAGRMQPDFEPTPSDLRAIVRICQLVQGLPLGILLAAGWLELLTPEEIAAEIERSIDFLETDVRDLPDRHRSIRAVFDSMWRLLTEPEQTVLAQLSIFRGSFTRSAAEHITGASLRDLMSMTHKSLLYRTPAGRYELHELLRQYAAEKAALVGLAGEALQKKYAAYYAGALEARLADLRGGKQQQALAEIEADIGNIRAVWNWAATTGHSRTLTHSLITLFHFYDMRSWFQEGAEAFRRAATRLSDQVGQFEAVSGETLLLGQLLARQGWFIFQLGRRGEAETLLQRSLQLLRQVPEESQSELVFSLNYLAAVQRHAGRYAEARVHVQENIILCHQIEDRFGLSIALNNLGQIAYAVGDYGEARRCCRQSLDLARALEHRWGIAFSLTNLGQVALALADYEEAEQLFQESLEIQRQISDRRGRAICLNYLGSVALAQGIYAEAKQRHRQALAILSEIGNQWGATNSLIKLGEVARAEDQDQVARTYFGEALRMAVEIQASPLIIDALVGVAALLGKIEAQERALEIVALVMNNPNSSRESQDRAASLLNDLIAAGLSAQAVTAAQERGQALNLDSLVEDLLAEFL